MSQDTPILIGSRSLSTMPPVVTTTFMRIDKDGPPGRRTFRLEIEVETYASGVELKITANDDIHQGIKVEALSPLPTS